jgi:uncharacterized protein YjiS (DUF1127 family)
MKDATHNEKTLPRMTAAARTPVAITALKDVVLHGNVVAGDPSIALLAQGPSGNDAFYAEPANAAMTRLPVANASATHAGMTGYELLVATRFERAALLGAFIVAVARYVYLLAGRALRSLELRRRVWATREALNRLDDHTLRDIGFDRSELAPLGLELKSEALYSQVRATLTPNLLPR